MDITGYPAPHGEHHVTLGIGRGSLSPPEFSEIDPSLADMPSLFDGLPCVRAYDPLNNPSDWATGPAFTVAAFHEGDPAITYQGRWTAENVGGAYGGTVVHASNSLTGITAATFRFSGTGVAWVTTLGPNRGEATISIDGGKPERVNLYSPVVETSRAAVALNSLAPGNHTLTITVPGAKDPRSTGARVDIDGFVVLR